MAGKSFFSCLRKYFFFILLLMFYALLAYNLLDAFSPTKKSLDYDQIRSQLPVRDGRADPVQAVQNVFADFESGNTRRLFENLNSIILEDNQKLDDFKSSVVMISSHLQRADISSEEIVRFFATYGSILPPYTVQNIEVTKEYTSGNYLLLTVHLVYDETSNSWVFVKLNAKPSNVSIKDLALSWSSMESNERLLFVLALLIPALCLLALYMVLNDANVKRKKTLGILVSLGFYTYKFNFIAGTYNYTPISILLLGSSIEQSYSTTATFASPIISIAVPVGAIIYLLSRGVRRLRVK